MRYIYIFIMVFFTTVAFGQSGWTRSKNTYFVKIAYNYFQSSSYFNPAGVELKTTTFKQQSVTLYGEYGITDRLTGIVNFPLYKFNGFESTKTVSGIGDLKLEVKYKLLKKDIPLTLSIAPEIPTGPANLYAQNKTVSFEKINLPTGDGEFNVWTTLAGSASFDPIPLYTSVSTAFNYRTKYKNLDLRNQMKFNWEVGYKIADLIWTNVLLTSQITLGEKKGETDFIRGDGTTFTGIGLGASYEVVDHWSISAQSWFYNDWIVQRKNIYSAPTFSLGVYYEIK